MGELLEKKLDFSLQTPKIKRNLVMFRECHGMSKLAVTFTVFVGQHSYMIGGIAYKLIQHSPFWGKWAASRSREMMDCCLYRSSVHAIAVLSLSSRVELGEQKSAINLQETGRLYCLSSRAQTCWGHPVRPLLFLSPAVEEDDDEDDDEVVLGIATCRHVTFIVIYIRHVHSIICF